MQRSATQSNDALSGWENEIFEDFVSDAEGVDLSTDQTPIVKVDALKNALALLADQGGASGVAAQGGSPVSSLGRPERAATASLFKEKPPGTTGVKPAEPSTIDCPELSEAFLEDTSRGVAALDQAVINYESNSGREDALGEILRELHTLKGASAVVGLTDISRYLHDIEDFVQDPRNAPPEITDVLLGCLKTLRDQSARLAVVQAGEAEMESRFVSETPHRIEAASEGEDAVSVKGEQLDRLLDMVTALTMLNNQRDSHVDQLRIVNANLNQCGNRIRDLERIVSQATTAEQPSAVLRSVGNPMREIGNDLGEIGKLLRDAYSPITQEHLAVSNFIRQFRHALVSILRMPVSGMFRRLQRAALDAARVERKQVRLQVIGSDAGLERSVQERLLDPLMHIVRNAVSHGIESPADRQKHGKDPVGTVTLEAISAPNLLTLNVRDDGRGLDYDALRRKGTKLGLLRNGKQATQQELGQLIFHRGFSTREEANEIAGRGIGMDVVVDTLEKMHAWIEVDSVPNEGTTIKLTVPLKSITEHALVVRVGEHLAAIPMQYVRSSDERLNEGAVYPELAHALGVASTSANTVVSLECVPSRVKTDSAPHSIHCLVDEILGPQEVVVRPLPPLLRHHRLIGGVTLSATGQVVYVLNPRRVVSSIESISAGELPPPSLIDSAVNVVPPIKILVVDDSLSARSVVSLLCRKKGWVAVEAQDGIAGLELLEQEEWAAIITDLDMPQMDGIEFIKSLRSRESMKEVPVLMVSSRLAEEMESKAKLAGATHYISKPLTVDLLDELIFPQSRNSR